MVSIAPDVIAVSSLAATRALLQRTRTIPIVFMVGGDPTAARGRGGPFSNDRGMDASLVLAELAP